MGCTKVGFTFSNTQKSSAMKAIMLFWEGDWVNPTRLNSPFLSHAYFNIPSEPVDSTACPPSSD